MFTSQAPSKKYIEIGVVEFPVDAHGRTKARTLGKFKKRVAPFLHKHGGNAVIALVNGMGYYIRGTVIRYVD